MNELDRWTNAVRGELGLVPAHPDEQKVVLDLARDVAHGVLRPAAPVSAYLLGVAVGQGAEPADAAAAIAALAGSWTVGPDADADADANPGVAGSGGPGGSGDAPGGPRPSGGQ